MYFFVISSALISSFIKSKNLECRTRQRFIVSNDIDIVVLLQGDGEYIHNTRYIYIQDIHNG